MLDLPDNPDPMGIRRTREGDRKAFQSLVRRHAPAVRALVEARIPGSPDLDRETLAAFLKIHRTLFLVRELQWFHLFCTRTTQAHLDRVAPHRLSPETPPWLARLGLGQREALFFAERAGSRVPFPAIEYLGISASAYEARLEAGRRHLARAASRGEGLPPPPPPDWIDGLLQGLDEALGPGRTQARRRLLPPLPLPLAFLLVLSLSALLVALLFRLPSPGEARAPPRLLEPGRAHRLLSGSLVHPLAGARLRVLGGAALALDRGRLRLELQAGDRLRVELGGRVFEAEAGSFELRVEEGRGSILPIQGEGTLRQAEGPEGGEPLRAYTEWPFEEG